MMDRQHRHDSIDRRSINIDECTSPIILASLIGVKEPVLDRLRQKGYLLQGTQTPLAENLVFYITKLKQLATGKVGELQEQLTISNTKKNIAQTEKIYQEMAIQKGEYIEVSEFIRLAEPSLSAIQGILHSIARDFPITKDKIADSTLLLHRLGEAIAAKAEIDQQQFVRNMMEQESDPTEAIEELKELFNIYE